MMRFHRSQRLAGATLTRARLRRAVCTRRSSQRSISIVRQQLDVRYITFAILTHAGYPKTYLTSHRRSPSTVFTYRSGRPASYKPYTRGRRRGHGSSRHVSVYPRCQPSSLMTGRGLDPVGHDGRWLRTGWNGGTGRGSRQTRLRDHGRCISAARSQHTSCPMGTVSGGSRPRVSAFRGKRGARTNREHDTATTSAVVVGKHSCMSTLGSCAAAYASCSGSPGGRE